MIAGVGIDLLEIGRIRRLAEREAFLKGVYTDTERENFREFPAVLAGNFAVKEAVAKALGTGFRGFRARDIEVLRDDLGKPYVNLYEGAARRAEELGVVRVHVSISDTDELVTALAVAETEAGTCV
ncbi:MAG: holo-ACP synthase [Lachnospiraceae bacterium]|nr:holo-ACP synthase [Lachnospiraceae bacterium]MBR2737417.1 holo-ACP synthase [Lachnospiraceae bacterium]MCR5538314.1 holo-ACP synthase [Lachnospiraceae bacterium]